LGRQRQASSQQAQGAQPSVLNGEQPSGVFVWSAPNITGLEPQRVGVIKPPRSHRQGEHPTASWCLAMMIQRNRALHVRRISALSPLKPTSACQFGSISDPRGMLTISWTVYAVIVPKAGGTR